MIPVGTGSDEKSVVTMNFDAIANIADGVVVVVEGGISSNGTLGILRRFFALRFLRVWFSMLRRRHDGQTLIIPTIVMDVRRLLFVCHGGC